MPCFFGIGLDAIVFRTGHGQYAPGWKQTACLVDDVVHNRFFLGHPIEDLAETAIREMAEVKIAEFTVNTLCTTAFVEVVAIGYQQDVPILQFVQWRIVQVLVSHQQLPARLLSERIEQ